MVKVVKAIAIIRFFQLMCVLRGATEHEKVQPQMQGYYLSFASVSADMRALLPLFRHRPAADFADYAGEAYLIRVISVIRGYSYLCLSAQLVQIGAGCAVLRP